MFIFFFLALSVYKLKCLLILLWFLNYDLYDKSGMVVEIMLWFLNYDLYDKSGMVVEIMCICGLVDFMC